jgi:hypothetical protein
MLLVFKDRRATNMNIAGEKYDQLHRKKKLHSWSAARLFMFWGPKAQDRS